MAIRSSWATGEVLTSDDLTDTVADKVSRQGDTLSGQLDSAQLTPMHQFAADGSVLANLPARVHPAEQLLKQAVWWIDAAHSSASGQSVSNLGWGGSALDAQVGSTGSADSNDPKYLDWQGENYVYLPGVVGNYLSVPDEAALDITGDLTLIWHGTMDNWTAAANLVNKTASASSQTSFFWNLNADGTTYFGMSSTGTGSFFGGSSQAWGFANGSKKWIAVTRSQAAGELKFWKSDDGVSWSQHGPTITGVSTADIYVGTAPVEVGRYNTASHAAAGAVHRVQVRSGIGTGGLPSGTPVLDIDCSQITSGSNTSFTALTGQTVTINRSTSGRKTVGVVHPRWLFGTDDYMQVADNDLIDFGASDSFTVLAVVRDWGTDANVRTYIAKRQSYAASSPGYGIYRYSSTDYVDIGDGTVGINDTVGATDTTVVALVRDSSVGTVTAWRNGSSSGSPTTDTTTATLANALPLRMGANNAGAYGEYEGSSFAIWRRALTAGEIATLNSYFQGREGA